MIDPHFIQTLMSFDIDSLTGPEIVDVFCRSVKFEVTKFRSSDVCVDGAKFTQKHLDKLRQIKFPERLDIEGELRTRGEHFSLIQSGAFGSSTLFWVTMPENVPDIAFLNELAQKKGFNAGFSQNYSFGFWQDVDRVYVYKMHNRCLDRVSTWYDPDHEEERVDISNNPARRIALPGFRLNPAWRMWFGPGAFPYFPPDRLMTFPGCRQREVLPNGTIFMELFEPPEEAEKPENYRLHQAFRDWTKMDDLEKRAGELAEEKADPSSDYRKVSLPNGGVTQITQWFDEAGKLVRRSRAAYRKTVVLNAAGQPVWQSEKMPARD
jgi:hypothetical protein